MSPFSRSSQQYTPNLESLIVETIKIVLKEIPFCLSWLMQLVKGTGVTSNMVLSFEAGKRPSSSLSSRLIMPWYKEPPAGGSLSKGR